MIHKYKVHSLSAINPTMHDLSLDFANINTSYHFRFQNKTSFGDVSVWGGVVEPWMRYFIGFHLNILLAKYGKLFKTREQPSGFATHLQFLFFLIIIWSVDVIFNDFHQ